MDLKKVSKIKQWPKMTSNINAWAKRGNLFWSVIDFVLVLLPLQDALQSGHIRCP